MKSLFSLFIGALLSVSAIAQDTGHTVYDIKISGDDPQVEMMKSFLDGAKMEMFFNENFSKVNIEMGTMMTINTIIDLKKKESLTLKSGMMGNTATKMTLEELDAKKADAPKPEIELVDETKEIAGLKCKKAIITTEDGTEMEMWYTDEIDAKNAQGMQMMSKEIPGFPVEFSSQQGPMTMLFTMTKYEPKYKADKSLFDMAIPEGYKETTVEDLGK